MLCLFAVLSLALGASACCVPDLYSAQGYMRIYRNGHFFQGQAGLYYDNNRGIHAGYYNLSMDEFPDTFSVTSVHIDTKTKILYLLSNGTCTSKKLDNSWAEETNQPGCIHIGDGTILQVRNLKLSLDDPAVLDLPDLCKKSAAAAPMEPLDAPVSFLPGLTRHLERP
ncbi:hypothetical protein Ahia01_001288200, partial [Argonauta hians]